MTVERTLDELVLVDQHLHSVFDHDLDRAGIEAALTEAPDAPEPPATAFDSQLGFAVRRYCAPVLGLPAFTDPDAYVARRCELGHAEVTRLLLRAAGISDYCIDGGYRPDELMDTATFARLGGGTVHDVVRLESVAERAVVAAATPQEFLHRLHAELDASGAVGFKTVAAYRCGLDLDPARPGSAEVELAAVRWHGSVTRGRPPRLEDPVLIRHLVWWALERGAVLQVHTGFGDPDLALRRADPALLQPLLARAASTPGKVVLLHCYPFERSAGYLAHAYPGVYVDTGLATSYLGANAEPFLRSTLDLVPFHKMLFSTDAWGLPELVLVGARSWRGAMSRVLSRYVARDGWPEEEAARIARMVGADNARVLYGLGG